MRKTLLFAFIFCSMQTQAQQTPKELSYLALGDSYTIGESVSENERWPNQLADSLNAREYQIEKPVIIAQTGWRTDDLIQAIKKHKNLMQFDLVSLLIGVNNQYQGKNIEVFKAELKTLIELAITHSKNGSSGVFILSIPDYGVTPFAATKNPDKIASEIGIYNSISKEMCEQFQISFFDITPISKKAKTDPSLLAEDGLHPSGKMYGEWVSIILKQSKTDLLFN